MKRQKPTQETCSGQNDAENRSESELIERAKKGEERAWRELIYLPDEGLSLQNKMLNTASKRLSYDWSGAEECVSEALMDTFRGIEKFRGDSKFSTWVFGILERKISNYIKENLTEDISLKKLGLEIREKIVLSSEIPNEVPSETVRAAIQAVLDSIEECIRENRRSYESPLPQRLEQLHTVLPHDTGKKLIEKWLGKINEKIAFTREVAASSLGAKSQEDSEYISILNNVADTYTSSNPEEMMMYDQLVEKIDQIIESKFEDPEQTREIIYSILVSGQKQKDIAARLGLSSASVSERMERFRKILKKEYPDFHLLGLKDEK